MPKIENIKQNYEKAVTDYVNVFLIKQDLHEDGEPFDHYWIGDDVGGVLDVASMCIPFDDIRLDIDEGVDAGVYYDYYDLMVYEDFEGNYRSYLMGKI